MFACHEFSASVTKFEITIDATPWPKPAPTQYGRLQESEPLPELKDARLGGRFRSWRGKSNRSYVFSVFVAGECPAYCEAVLIAVAIEAGGKRRAIAFTDTGSFPEPIISRLARSCSTVSDHLEFHVHLLADTAAEREFILHDIRCAA
jgi:hypothetical protein